MKKIILILIAAISFSSCQKIDDFLDVKPIGKKIPGTIEDFDLLLNDYGTSYPTWTNMTYLDPDVYVTDDMFPDFWQPKWKRMYTWQDDFLTQQEDDYDWTYKYRMIYVYNLVINDGPDAPLGQRSEADRKRVIGEAYAQRALDYFLLVTEYAPAYAQANFDKPAIPLALKNDIEAQLPRATVKEVYDQILADLLKSDEFVKDDLPNHNIKANFRPGKAGIKGLLSLVYLHMGDWAKSAQYAQESIDLYNFLYDYTTIGFQNPSLGAWGGLNVFDFDYSTDAKSVLWNRYHRWTFYDPAQLYHPDLLALFDKTNDQRFILFSSDHTRYDPDVSLSPNVAYARYYAENQAGVTTENVILVKAEANARLGKMQETVDALNMLLKKRIKNWVDMPATAFASPAAALQYVKNERRKELMATANNFVDLKRYHAYGETIPTFTRTIAGQTYTLAPGSSKYVVPISAKTKSFNPNL